MRLNRYLLCAAALLTAALACKKNTDPAPEPDPDPEPTVEITVPAFAKGADISWVSEMEKGGRKFKKKDGTAADILDVLKDEGINAIRLRVWVNPTGGWSGKDDLLALAKRVQAAGLPLMVDFHYSDFFADPTRQTVPSTWSGDTGSIDKMTAHVSEHTTEVLQALKDAGISPAWVQVGNETRNGMLWPTGQLWAVNGSTPGGWAQFVKLYMAGYNAVKALFPEALVMPHLNNAFKSSDNDWWIGEFKKNGARFDMIAFSHYPQYESDWSATQTQAISSLKTIQAKYGVPVMVSEVGVKTPANETLAKQILSEFLSAARSISGLKGVFYWEPEVDGTWKPAVYSSLGWNAYDYGAFTTAGQPTSVMDCFKE